MSNSLEQNPRNMFWLLQTGFWLFISVVSYLILIQWYAEDEWIHSFHTLVQALLGMLLTLPMYWTMMRYWETTVFRRTLLGLLLVAALSLVWTAARLEAFVILTDVAEVWRDFGGWYFSSFFIFLCWISMFHGIRYYLLLQSEHRIMLKAEAEAKDEQLKRMRAQSVARDAQIKMLRYQLNPHFLCNTLNAINSLVEIQETEKAQSMTVQLSQFLRYSLDNNPDTKVALESEIKAINLYLEIEKTRFGERLTVDFRIDPEAKPALVPSLLLQPIIENSMKHAIAQSERGGTIGLRAHVIEDRLLLMLSDTGPDVKVSRSKLKSTKGRGVGLRNTGERLEALYDDDYSVELSIMPSGGLQTSIEIPYETHL